MPKRIILNGVYLVEVTNLSVFGIDIWQSEEQM